MYKPLNGIKVLDLTRVLSGPYAAMVMGDLGAEIIKIEMLGKGDDARSFPPFIEDESAYFMSINRNKKSLTLNLKSEEGKAIFLDLVKKVDVVLENFRPGTMEKLGLDYDDLSKVNPSIIYAACSGYGRTGPYSKRAAYDMIVQAMGGMMSITGTDEDHPCRVGSSVGDIFAGLYTAIGIMAALRHRDITGEGQIVDVAMLDCQVAVLENAISRYFVTGIDPKPIGNRHPSVAPFGEFKSKNGYLVITAGNDALFQKLCEAIGASELSVHEKFCSNELRVTNVDELTGIINSYLKNKDTQEWVDIFNSLGIPCAPINKISQMLQNPQVNAREMIVETQNTKGIKVKMPGVPIKFSKTPVGIDSPPPILGEHSREILREYLGYSDDKLDELFEKEVI